MSLIAGNLGFVQRLLDGSQMRWAVCAGAAAHLYGNRRPIQDVDLLVEAGEMRKVVELLRGAQKAVQFDGQRIIWRGIKVFDDLSIRQPNRTLGYRLDGPMIARLRRMSLLGAPVLVIAPEDVFVHKIVLARGANQGKFDLEDAAGIVRRQVLDRAYLSERRTLMGGDEAMQSQIEAFISEYTPAPGN